MILDPNYLPYFPRSKYMTRRCLFSEIIGLSECGSGCDVTNFVKTQHQNFQIRNFTHLQNKTRKDILIFYYMKKNLPNIFFIPTHTFFNITKLSSINKEPQNSDGLSLFSVILLGVAQHIHKFRVTPTVLCDLAMASRAHRYILYLFCVRVL